MRTEHPTGNYVNDKYYPLDFSRGENPFLCSPVVAKLLRNTSRKLIANYPDNLEGGLIKAIAVHFACDVNQAIIGTGSLGLLFHVARYASSFCQKCVFSSVTFPIYGILARQHGMGATTVNLRQDWRQDIPKIGATLQTEGTVVFLANPNNPTGLLEEADAIQELIACARAAPKSLLVIDEANIEYCDSGVPSVLPVSEWPINVLVIRSFSKAYGLAGIRVGYALGQSALIEKLYSFYQDYTVSQLAQNAAVAALSDQKHLAQSVNLMSKGRVMLFLALSNFGFNVIPSDSNFLLVDLSSKNVHTNELLPFLNNNGVQVLSGDRFNGLGSSFIRVTPRTISENQLLMDIFQAWERTVRSSNIVGF